jgi:hypothetical protein
MNGKKIINSVLLIKKRKDSFEKPLTLRQASSKMVVGLTALHDLESGTIQNPRLKTLISVCEFYDISLFEILEAELSGKMMEAYLNKMVANGIIPEITKNKMLSYHKIIVSPALNQQ